MYEVVVIGSGLGGLSSGYILAKNGFKVTVLEQNPCPGGCLQCFCREGVKFETGMHFIGSAAPGQTMDRMMRYFALSEDVVLDSLDAEAYNTVDVDGGIFRFPSGREAFLERMGSYFPKEKDALQSYVHLVDEIARASSPHSLLGDGDATDALLQYRGVAVDAVLDSLFRDDVLKKALAGDAPLYCGRAGKTPFSLHAFIMDFYNRSAFRIAGGSDAISSSLVRSIENLGGKVLTNRKAVSIECDGKRAVAVRSADGTLYAADWVISAVHPSVTLGMLDTPLLRPAYRSRIAGLPQTEAAFSLYVKFKPSTMPYMNTNFFCHKGVSPLEKPHSDSAAWPESFLYMHSCHEPACRQAVNGTVLAYMDISELERWKDTAVGRRGEDYEEFKRMKAEKVIAAVERAKPGFAQSLESWYTSTPLTYRDYTGTRNGAIYGVAQDVTLGAGGRVSHRTRIPNLLLAGQSTNSHGILGVLTGTLVACSEIVPRQKLYEQIYSDR